MGLNDTSQGTSGTFGCCQDLGDRLGMGGLNDTSQGTSGTFGCCQDLGDRLDGSQRYKSGYIRYIRLLSGSW